MVFPPAMAILVNQRFGHISACLGYRWDGDTVRPMHVWAEDGFSGRRAAVELMRCLEASADADGLELVFTARAWNQGLRSAVEQHGCEPLVGEDAETVVYRRKARRWAEA